jgi:hypothetical protein
LKTLTRALSHIACAANCHPHVVLAFISASIVAVIGLGVFGAVSLVTHPTLSRFLLFAVVTAAALVAIQRNFTKG